MSGEAIRATEPAAEAPRLPAVETLLATGGDDRIRLTSGRNRYGCPPLPETGLIGFGSSTASTLSPAGLAAAARRHAQLDAALRRGAPEAVYAEALAGLRGGLVRGLGLEAVNPAVIFAASGTDAHLFVGQLVAAGAAKPPRIVLCGAGETGRGVGLALAGRAFGSSAPHADALVAGERIPGAQGGEVVEVAVRNPEGAVRPSSEVDAEVEALVADGVAQGRRVLLVVVDVSKTGLVAPSPGLARELAARHPGEVEVLVDACQLRLSGAALAAYLGCGFLVALTGSKFLGGPAFSAALLVPAAARARLEGRRLPAGLAAYAARADWPPGWAGADALPRAANFGLVLRWAAALDSLEAFAALSPELVARFALRFEAMVGRALDEEPALAAITRRRPRRAPLAADGWDTLDTVFPFALAPQGAPLGPAEAAAVHRFLRLPMGVGFGEDAPAAAALKIELGQPVVYGRPAGAPAAALRLCLGARNFVEARADGAAGEARVLDQGREALAKAGWLARRLADLG